MKKWWKEIKSLTAQNIQQEWFHQFLDDKCPDTKSLANRVNDHFINLTADFERIPVREPIIQQVPRDLLVTVKEVQHSLSGVNVGKAIDPDMIPNKILKEFAPELALPVANIYNCSLEEGSIPDLLKRSFVKPLPKVSPPQSIQTDTKVMEGFACSKYIKCVRCIYIYRMKNEKIIFKPLAGIELHIFGLLCNGDFI